MTEIEMAARIEYTSVNGYVLKAYSNNVRYFSGTDANKLLEHLSCPIGMSIIKTPVVFNGIVYDHENILKWLRCNDRDPATNVQISAGSVKLGKCMDIFVLLLSLEEMADGIIALHQFATTAHRCIQTARDIYNGRKLCEECVHTSYFAEEIHQYYQIDCEETLDYRYRLPIRLIEKQQNDHYTNDHCIDNSYAHRLTVFDETVMPIENLLFYGNNGNLRTDHYSDFDNAQINNEIYDQLRVILNGPYVKQPPIFLKTLDQQYHATSSPKLAFYCNISGEEDRFLAEGDRNAQLIANDASLAALAQRLSNMASAVPKISGCLPCEIVNKINNIVEELHFPQYGQPSCYGGEYSHLTINGVTFTENLKGWTFVKTHFKNCDFRTAIFEATKIIGCTFENCTFNGASIRQTCYIYKNKYMRCDTSLPE
jgi:hypothetical protein